MAWAGEELIGFGASFDGARFAAAGAVRDFGTCVEWVGFGIENFRWFRSGLKDLSDRKRCVV